MAKYIDKEILLVDDINDSGTTLLSIDEALCGYALDAGSDFSLRVATLFSKTTSDYQEVDYYARELTPDNDPWIVFPYEQWWNFDNKE